MTVLFFTRLFYPHIGGVEKHVLKISVELIKRGHKVIIVTEKHDNKLKNKEVHKGISIYRIKLKNKGWFKKFNVWFWLFKNRNLMRESDVIHAHDVYYWYMPFRFVFPFKRSYVTFHGYEGNKIPSVKFRLISKIYVLLSDGNICIGDYITKWVGIRANLVSYGAIDRLDPNYIPIKKNNINALFIGRLEEETGILKYLQVMKKMNDKKIALKLTVLGDGALMKSAKKYTNENNLRVVFKGFVSEVDRYISNSEIVFTSRYLSTMESFAHKKPVLIEYNNQVKKDCFVLSPYRKWIYIGESVEELEEKFMQILNDNKKLLNNIDKSYNWVKSRTWESFAENYIKLWKGKYE